MSVDDPQDYLLGTRGELFEQRFSRSHARRRDKKDLGSDHCSAHIGLRTLTLMRCTNTMQKISVGDDFSVGKVLHKKGVLLAAADILALYN